MARKLGSWVFADATERDTYGAAQGIETGDVCSLESDQTSYHWDGGAWAAHPDVITGSLNLMSANPLLLAGNGSGSPVIRIDADLSTGSGNLQFFKNNALKWGMQNTTTQALRIYHTSLGTALSFSDSSADATFSFDVAFDRTAFSEGTAIVAGDFALSAGWGDTASVASAGGTDAQGFVEVQANGSGIAADPTITLTFTDGAWGSAPVAILQRNDTSSPLPTAAYLTYTSTTTDLVIAFRGTPVSGNTYRIEWRTAG